MQLDFPDSSRRRIRRASRGAGIVVAVSAGTALIGGIGAAIGYATVTGVCVGMKVISPRRGR